MHSTIIAAGFIVLKVESEETEKLVFQDIRDDSFDRKEEQLVCKEIAQRVHETRTSRKVHWNDDILKLQKEKKTKDEQVLGQYARESKFG